MRTPTTRPILLLLTLATAAGLAGCGSWAQLPQHKLRIDAPAKAKVDEYYTFKVHVTTADGKEADGVRFGWMIDWPDVKGMLHTGISSEPQQMKPKGGPGKALLRVYANDATGRRSQVDKFEFQVE